MPGLHSASIGCTLAAGLAGGLAGAAAMAGLQFLLRPHLRRWGHLTGKPDAGIGFQALFRLPEPTSLTAARAAPLKPRTRAHAFSSAILIHEGFGAAASLPYVLLRGPFPAVSAGSGLLYGVAVWGAAAELALPALSLSRHPARSSTAVQVFGFAAHLTYGAVLEAACKAVLGPPSHSAVWEDAQTAPAASLARDQAYRASGIRRIAGSPASSPHPKSA